MRMVGTEGRNEGGFSLMEIMVGITILTVGLMGLGYAMVTSYHVERVSVEKKIAMDWACSQVEALRAGFYSDMIKAPPTGFLVLDAWADDSVASRIGSRKDNASGVPLYFVRNYYVQGTAPYTGVTPNVPLTDDALTGLRPQDGKGDLLGTVEFIEPTLDRDGIETGSGYWVTVKVFWKGAAGNSELKISTFVGK